MGNILGIGGNTPRYDKCDLDRQVGIVGRSASLMGGDRRAGWGEVKGSTFS
ncbi:hypothetical protein [Microcoleus sp. herbarium12]|uniref:hypothetical protein n=1 Tax=Microcoleus sp. herbarium12 TaxID=3055437 RepID=UPI002FD7038D